MSCVSVSIDFATARAAAIVLAANALAANGDGGLVQSVPAASTALTASETAQPSASSTEGLTSGEGGLTSSELGSTRESIASTKMLAVRRTSHAQ